MAIKRLHDRNMSGWWVLSFILILPMILLFIPSKGEPNRFGAWRQTRGWEKVLGIIYLLFLIASLVLPFVGAGFLAANMGG